MPSSLEYGYGILKADAATADERICRAGRWTSHTNLMFHISRVMMDSRMCRAVFNCPVQSDGLSPSPNEKYQSTHTHKINEPT